MPFIPAPSGLHAVPFHRAIRLAATPFTAVKDPAAIRSPLKTASARVNPVSRVPRIWKDWPSHFATSGNPHMPPGAVNSPPRIRSPRQFVSAVTSSSSPTPTVFHAAPFQRATFMTEIEA